ncbi:MAG: hypothetical protein CVU56_16570 [Deltaproteobacteria bacterium HGW-Deltaproteobacteria-14]|jgi:SAM-dependent methyltransferase|nr:MAG: hypothetical protein CVU56_16570 [Deltaproteobacteria bacterium HGW-Deltaproteobacteria-14]
MTVNSRVSPRWESPKAVAAFEGGRPNQVLVAFARAALEHGGGLEVLDVGCGAGRNAVPLAEMGYRVTGTDLSGPMIEGARRYAAASSAAERLRFLQEPMAQLPFEDASFDLVIAHGIWNLATTDAELRAAIAEAGRVARPGAGLFLFTFSRSTLPAATAPVAGQSYVYTEFNGEPACFLTEAEVLGELAAAGFSRRPEGPLTEYNRPDPDPGHAPTSMAPAIWEGMFLRAG